MARLRIVCVALAALIVACGAMSLTAVAAAPFGALAQAHPEPNDVDGDLILNADDNCPTTPNGSQTNTDVALPGGDMQGDACDADDDADGVSDGGDNCQYVPNPLQENSDGIGRGDACPFVDGDRDGRFEDDNCPAEPNPDQRDLDGDDKGDVCDRDDDNDKYDDGFDNCPAVFNPDQADLDADKVGSACDAEERIGGPPPPPGGAPTPGAPTPGAGAGAFAPQAPGPVVPGASPVPGGSAVPGGPADRSAPLLTVEVDRRPRLRDSGRALVVRATCSEACGLEAVVAADAKAARLARLGSARVVVARGSWSLAAAGRTYIFARWSASARRLRPGRRLRAALRLTATDAAGNERTVTKRIDLRR